MSEKSMIVAVEVVDSDAADQLFRHELTIRSSRPIDPAVIKAVVDQMQKTIQAEVTLERGRVLSGQERLPLEVVR